MSWYTFSVTIFPFSLKTVFCFLQHTFRGENPARRLTAKRALHVSAHLATLPRRSPTPCRCLLLRSWTAKLVPVATRSRAFICSSIICNIWDKVPITFPSHVIRKYHLKQRLQIECISLLRLIEQMSESLVSEAIPAISEGGGDGLRPADSCQVGMMVQQCLSRSWKSRLYVKFMNF